MEVRSDESPVDLSSAEFWHPSKLQIAYTRWQERLSWQSNAHQPEHDTNQLLCQLRSWLRGFFLREGAKKLRMRMAMECD